MAIHYPTEFNIFAVVLTEDKNAIPRDKGLLRECQNRIPWFYASRELDETLYAVLELEQRLGKKVDWTASDYTYDTLIRIRKHRLPNKSLRFCTEVLKVLPIFTYSYLHYYDGSPILMNLGFRYDEPKRVEKYNCKNNFNKLPYKCSLFNQRRQRWTKDIEWRVENFPLYQDKITEPVIIDYMNKENFKFPKVSNCDFCFFHNMDKLQYQVEKYAKRLEWWTNFEKEYDATFGKIDYKSILNGGIINNTLEEFNCGCTD